MCVKTKGNKTQANHPDWYFTDETIAATIELTKYLMKLYNIPAERVVRHYDVTGKYCPGVVGWNAQSGSENAWKEFKSKLTTTAKTSTSGKTYRVQVGAFSVKSNAEKLAKELKSKGYDAIVV